MRTAIKTISSLDRLKNSVNGNPRYKIIFVDGECAMTSSDMAFCYAITNPEYRDRPLEVTFTRAGRVCQLKPI